jgi:hypothetical protein
MKILDREPVAVLDLIKYIVAAGVAFGLPIDAEQKVALLGLAAALLTFITRQKVSPVKKETAPSEG